MSTELQIVETTHSEPMYYVGHMGKRDRAQEPAEVIGFKFFRFALSVDNKPYRPVEVVCYEIRYPDGEIGLVNRDETKPSNFMTRGDIGLRRQVLLSEAKSLATLGDDQP